MCDVFQEKAKKITEMFRYLYPDKNFDEKEIEQKLRHDGTALAISLERGLTMMCRQKTRNEQLKNPND